MMTRHLLALHKFYGELAGVRIARKHIGWYVSKLAGGKSLPSNLISWKVRLISNRFLQQFFQRPS